MQLDEMYEDCVGFSYNILCNLLQLLSPITVLESNKMLENLFFLTGIMSKIHDLHISQRFVQLSVFSSEEDTDIDVRFFLE